MYCCRSDEVSDEILSAVTSQNLLIQEPEIYTIESNCDLTSDIDNKQTDDISDDNDVIGNFLNDPLDVQAWVQPIEDSLGHHNELPPSYPFDDLPSDPTDQNISQQLPQNMEVSQDEVQEENQQTILSQIQPQEEPKCSSQNYDKCIVCARVFKNPNSLEKHLRNVHTAHIIRPELTTSIKKSSEYRRIVLNKKPIKENVAKALVSKLNKKNQQNLEQAANSSTASSSSSSTITTTSQPPTAQIEMNPHYTQNVQAIVSEASWNGSTLTSITGDKNPHIENGNTIIIISNVELNPATSNGYTFTNYHHQANTVALPKLVPISGLKTSTQTITAYENNNITIKDNNSCNEITNHEITEKFPNTSPKVFIIDKGGDKISQHHQIHQIQHQQQQQQPKPPKASSPDDNEHHQCPECEKVFQKKYQLKRHQEIHENLFYFCPFCKRAPVKARSSLRKHFIKDHPEHQDTWQASNFMSTLLKKYEKIKKSSHESQTDNSSSSSTKKTSNKKVSNGKKEGKKSNNNKKEKLIIESNDMTASTDNNNCEIINDQPLPQISIDNDDTSHQQQQIILSNLFLDPITLDEENNLIKYTLAGEDDFIMNGHNGESSVVNMTHTASIESYEMSEFSNFKSSFDEIQEKLDAELEFNNDQMIKWSDELDDSSSVISSQSTSNLSASDIGKSLGKQKNGFMLT